MRPSSSMGFARLEVPSLINRIDDDQTVRTHDNKTAKTHNYYFTENNDDVDDRPSTEQRLQVPALTPGLINILSHPLGRQALLHARLSGFSSPRPTT
jgi:hypothetical protein